MVYVHFSKKIRIAFLMFISGALVSLAGTTWDGGGGDDNWGTGNNWNPDGSPPVGSAVDLNFAGSTRLTPFNNYTAWDDFRNLYFDSGAGSFTISGNAIDFFGKIENNSANTQTLNIDDFAFNSGNSELNPVSGDLVMGSSSTSGQDIFNNGNDVNVYGSGGHKLTLNMTINGTGKLILKQNSIIEVNETQNYTGNTELDAGEMWITANGDLSSSSAIFVGNGGATGTDAKFYISDLDGGTTFDNDININNGDGSTGNRVVGSFNTSGKNTFSGGISMSGTTTLFAENGGEVEFSGVISGAGQGTIIDGGGTVIFNNSMTYDGDTTVSDGTLKLAASHRINDSSALIVEAAGTFDMNNFSETVGSLAGAGSVSMGTGQLIAGEDNSSTTFSGIMSGDASGSFVKKGTGTMTLDGANTYAGDTFIVGGTLKYNANQGAGYTGDIKLGETSGSDSATLALGNGVTLSNDIEVRSGSSGTKTIDAQNTSGETELSGDVLLSDNVDVNTASGGDLKVSGVISGSGKLVKKGGDELTLSGNNTFTGNLEVDAGVVNVDEGGNVSDSSHIFVGNGGATGTEAQFYISDINGGTTISTPITVNAGDGSLGNRRIGGKNTSGINTFSGAIDGAGYEIYATSGGQVDFTGTMASTFPILKTGEGTVELDLSAASAAEFHVDNGTLAGDSTIGALEVNDGGTISPGLVGSGAGTLNAGDTTFAGGGSYLFEVEDFNDALDSATGDDAGAQDWDLLNISGDLNITATSANPFIIDLASILGTGASGQAANFNHENDYLLNIATFSGSINNFSADKFTIDFSNFQNLNPFPNNWVVQVTGQNLQLLYTGAVAVPEPNSIALCGMGSFLLFRLRRKRGKKITR